MKKIAIIALCIVGLGGLYACNNSLDKVFDSQTLVEFQPAVLNANSVGRTYPLISTGNSVTAGATVAVQLNLVGLQRATDTNVKILLDPTGTTANPANYTLSNGNATLSNGGTVVIPANTSFGSLTMIVGKATSTTAPVTNVVLLIDSTSTDFKPSQNYKRVGYSFRN